MAGFEQIDGMLREIGDALGQDLRLDPDGTVVVQTAAGLDCTLSLPPDDSELRLAMAVADLAGHERIPLFEAAMRSAVLDEEAPLLRPGLLGDEQQIVVLARLPREGLTSATLAGALASFLRRATVLHDTLRMATRPAQHRTDDPVESMPMRAVSGVAPYAPSRR